MSTAPVNQQPSLIIVFLDQATQKFVVASDKTLQLAKTGDGLTSLGFVEQRAKKLPDGTAVLNSDGKPEIEQGFVTLLSFPVDIVQPKKIELATAIPDGIPVPTKKPRAKKSVN